MTEGDAPRRNIRLLIAYDGTDFSGWQRQRGTRTVQGTIELALQKLHKEAVGLIGAGRTDAGVHARGQIAHFHTAIRAMAPESFVPALNSLLPRDVRILRAEAAAPHFHARFDAVSRTYRYRLVCGRPAFPEELRYCLALRRRPRIEALNGYARLLRGETDCTLFAASGDPCASKNRYLFNAVFFVQGDTLVFEITANAFLWKMVRSVVGTLLFCEERGVSPDRFRRMIASKDRSLAGPTAPPQGLSLWKTAYPPPQPPAVS
ncbi:MAG: tRNA pseudouridine(38-40) synthase TruA [Spirochaetaceae bacterium]|jgi:tRNA pseudouridine38-40 synthase|nr:tRNA pseudouridine(38-40) synthase TruA [Spirochaetaceae bacterium]